MKYKFTIIQANTPSNIHLVFTNKLHFIILNQLQVSCKPIPTILLLHSLKHSIISIIFKIIIFLLHISHKLKLHIIYGLQFIFIKTLLLKLLFHFITTMEDNFDSLSWSINHHLQVNWLTYINLSSFHNFIHKYFQIP